jgi:hypothetical protein
MSKQLKFLLGDAQKFDFGAEKPDLLILEISRPTIKSGLTGSVVNKLMTLSDNADCVKQYAGKLELWFSGWDEDPRELAQIPEVVSFFRSVNAQWKYWLHFLHKPGTMITLCLQLLCDVQAAPGAKGALRFVRPEQLQTTLFDLFAGMNNLYACMGVDDDANRAMTKLVTADLERCFVQ